MQRMKFVPGPEAKREIHEAEGLIYFNRAAALDYIDTFIYDCHNELGGDPNVQFSSMTRNYEVLSLLAQLAGAALSEGDRVDIHFGLRSPDPSKGEQVYQSEEEIGHTWAVFNHADGRKETIWEVGRDTPYPGEAWTVRAFNGYRQQLWKHLGDGPEPMPMSIYEGDNTMPAKFRDIPVMSRALSPGNLYRSSGRLWYFVDLAPPGDLAAATVLSRPMRVFDALILASLVTVAYGKPANVFAVSYTDRIQELGRMPESYLRVQLETDERRRDINSEEVLLVM